MAEGQGSTTLDECARVLQQVGRRLYRAGQLPATSGNLSLRIDREACAITASGRDKGRLSRADIVRVPLSASGACGSSSAPVTLETGGDGRSPVSALRPSAETPLHTSLYRRYPNVGAVFHTHSIPAAVISRLVVGEALELEAYELAKAFSGVTDPRARVSVPLFDNDPDMDRLAQTVLAHLHERRGEACFAYVIRSHGAYVWGATWQEAFRHHEALEFMLACELEVRTRAATPSVRR